MAWLALTSSSAAAQDRGGQLRTPSSRRRSWGPWSLAPGAGSACPPDQPHWWRDSGASRSSWDSRASPGQYRGPRWRLCAHIRHSAAMRLMYPGKVPSYSSLRPQKPFLLQPGCGSGTKEKNTHISSLSSFHPLSGLGLAGASLLSHLSLAATASEFHSSPQQSVGVEFSHILAPLPQRRHQGPETQFPLRLLLSRYSFTTQDSLHPHLSIRWLWRL